MVNKVISLEDHLFEPLKNAGQSDTEHEAFLLEEGLELLAAYRTIADRDVRLALMSLIQTMAKAQKSK